MQFLDRTLTVVAFLFGFVVTCLFLAPLLFRYKGKISESSILPRLALLILLAFGVGSTLFVSFVLPGFTMFVLTLAIPVTCCFGLVITAKKEIEKELTDSESD